MNDNKRIELEALITEREGMVAMNMQREHLGQSMAYEGNAFVFLADKMRALKEPEPAQPYTPEDVVRLVAALGAILARVHGRQGFDANALSRCAEAVEEIAKNALAPFKARP